MVYKSYNSILNCCFIFRNLVKLITYKKSSKYDLDAFDQLPVETLIKYNIRDFIFLVFVRSRN